MSNTSNTLNPCLLSISEAANLLRSRQLSAVELTESHIALLEKFKSNNAFISIDYEAMRRAAAISDTRIKNGTAGPLEGIPVAIKDIFCTEGEVTTSGSRILSNYIAPYESTVTAKLKASGVVPTGKGNMDEFGMGSDNTNSAFGPVINPWRSFTHPETDLVPGGSSGGSAAAVASYQCMASLGSDTGGSVRQPASFTGLVGIKPTYGRCSRWGMIAFASSLDQAGVLARSVHDAALVLDTITGYDPNDATSLDLPPTRCAAAVATITAGGNIRGLRIGIPAEYKLPDMAPEIVEMWEAAEKWLSEEGAEIIPISLPNTDNGVASYYIIAPAEASSNLARYDGIRFGMRIARPGQSVAEMMAETRSECFGAEVKRRIMIGTYSLSAGTYDKYYAQAQRVRRMIANDFDHAFAKVDVILAPTAPTPAYGIGRIKDPVMAYLNDVFTIPTSLAGLPAISVPCGLSTTEKLPLGLQVIGKYCHEDDIFRTAAALEQRACFPRDRLINTLGLS